METTAHQEIRGNGDARAKATQLSVSRLRDQVYTRPDIAAMLYEVFLKHFDPASFLLVEPSAGTGSFYKLFPTGSRGFDIEPKCPGVENANFLFVELPQHRPIAVIGNPPFGKQGSLSVSFFNRAAKQADVIAFVVPKSFKKASVINRLDDNFHFVDEEPVPSFAFLFDGEPYDVSTVFQIWERRSDRRAPLTVATAHPDFEFVTALEANFCIQRIGALAGRLHHDFTRSRSSTYFIRASADVEAIMRKLDLRAAAMNVVAKPSLAKSELVSRYAAYIAVHGSPVARLAA